MNILMVTNTFTPHVGGVACSVEAFTRTFRAMGHRVLVIAPTFEGMDVEETDVVRIPAIQNFNGSDFSVRLPVPAHLFARVAEFEPDVIHSHHPFLLGDTALRLASQKNAPLVFTHHTMYERYTHYVPGDSSELQNFVIQLATGYANLCNGVFAPSESVRDVIEKRGVVVPVHVVPTGVDVASFSAGDGARAREKYGVPENAFVVGHVGRLAREKNLVFLSRAVGDFLKRREDAYFVIGGDGSLTSELKEYFEKQPYGSRVRFAGVVHGTDLHDIYASMDVFAFASETETQGLVLAEAMAAGTPVVAIDASGAREVVRDGENGRLLRGQHRKKFADALSEIHGMPAQRRAELEAAARATAEEFSRERCARRAIECYESLLETSPSRIEFDDTLWLASLRYIETEHDLVVNRVESAGKFLRKSRWWRSYLGKKVRIGFRAAKRLVSRAEWIIHSRRLSVSNTTTSDPGLILIQIDGLPRSQFELALANGKLPFLRRLLKQEGYSLESFYSGVPSTTAAVQAELFYGKRAAVPAFAFYRKRQLFRMFLQPAASEIERELGTEQRALLEHGSAYSNIYTGGAAEPFACPAMLGWMEYFRVLNPVSLLFHCVMHPILTIRTILLLVLELVIATMDSLHGIVTGEPIFKELKFVPIRLAVCVLLREIITASATLDAARGLPVIHLNYLAYDEHAHRRGPGSHFAHWTLKGIDDAIRRVWLAAQRSRRRDYEVWMYSDHGQESSIPFERENGRSLGVVLKEVFDDAKVLVERRHGLSQGTEHVGRRWRDIAKKFIKRLPLVSSDTGEEVRLAAEGPIGHVYCSTKLDGGEMHRLAEAMVHGGVPVVLYRDGPDVLRAVDADGSSELPRDAARVFGTDHPFLDDVAADLSLLASHPNSGDFMLIGWRPGRRPVSFHLENGSHGGPGTEETHGFAVLPARLATSERARRFYRPLELRSEALRYLDGASLRSPVPPNSSGVEATDPDGDSGTILRIATYNVHGCVGVDGTLSPPRIARVLAQYAPDVVALQELDVGRERSEHEDQAHSIAERLSMHLHFHPALRVEEERFGDAVLSRYPMRLVRSGPLPRPEHKPYQETRGALWTEIDVYGTPVQVITTHLGLDKRERVLQAGVLQEWVEEALTIGPTILLGDLNAFPSSKVHRMLTTKLRDTAGPRPAALRTFPSRMPLAAIDYVFASSHFTVRKIVVPRTRLTRYASDHLPVIAELELRREARSDAVVPEKDAGASQVRRSA